MHAQVMSTQQLTPSLVRVVLGGDGLRDFAMPATTDAYVNLAFPPADAPYAAPFDPAEVREAHPRELWPARRRYTVRSWDPSARELTLDFVVHGDVGVAGAWASSARPGDLLVLEGPSGGYHPDPEADWHLMVGDESALPAIAASLGDDPRRGPCRRPAPLRRPRPPPGAGLPGATRRRVAAPHRAGRRHAAGLRAPRPDVPAGLGTRVHPRRGRRDPRDPAAPADRARPDPPESCPARRTGAGT